MPRFLVLALLAVAGWMDMSVQAKEIGFPNAVALNEMAARFAPTDLQVSVSGLSAGDRAALAKLVMAGRVIDDIFFQQYWSGNEALYEKLRKDTTPLGKARLNYFWINKGPWSNLDGFEAFLPDVPKRKPEGANFYPADMTKEEFERWAATLLEKEQNEAQGFFTVIRRTGDGKLKVVPYSEEYKDNLRKASQLLREAAALTENASLKRFLTTRADAFLSNDYYESDMAWMDLDAPLDITIGPYETYNDELFGYKAAFEAYINVRDDAESTKLAAFASHLQQLEDNLPLDPKYRNPKLGAAAPIRVVDEILAAGDGAHGVATAAYNLPNDDRVVQQKGSKRVMLKNVQEAKFQHVLVPIAGRVLAKSAQPDVKFEPFFTHILTHELMHGLGPHQIQVAGRATTPREEMKELYSAIEEAKADVTGLWALQYMMDHAKEMGLEKVLSTGPAAERQLYSTYLASSFRTLRFGLHEAHGRGMAIQVNYLMAKGAFVAEKDGTFSVNLEKAKTAVQDLDHDLLTMEAEGNYAAAKKMLDDAATLRPEFQAAFAKLKDIPTDIAPHFVTAEKLAPSTPAKPKTSAAPKLR
jgi:Peptidase family M49